MSRMRRKKPSYFIEAESVVEMARLTDQAELVTEQIGLLPKGLVLPARAHILDLGCGPGEWVLAVAKSSPQCEVTGIDLSQMMITYAKACARQHGFANAGFQRADLREELPYPADSIDLIHARFLVGVLTRDAWPALLAECLRLLKPGGVLCHVEQEFLLARAPHCNQFGTYLVQALKKSGQAFADHGQLTGILAVMEALVREARSGQATFGHIERQFFGTNFSAGQKEAAYAQTLLTAIKLLQPFLLRKRVVRAQTLQHLVEQCEREIQSEAFCGLAVYQRIVALKEG